MKKGRVLLSLCAAMLFLSTTAFPNGFNLNSLGTKALAMGGAFVGLADDFSTVFWNPAGIANFDQKYFGFYGGDIVPSGSYNLTVNIPFVGTQTLVDAETIQKHYLDGLAGYYHPINERLVVGIGAYTPSGLGANWDGRDFTNIAGGNGSLKWTSLVGLFTIAPCFAYKVNDNVSIGAALNVNYGKFDINMHAGEVPVPGMGDFDMGQYEEALSGWGFGATVGLLVKLNDMFSFGATLRTPSKIKFSGDAEISNLPLLGMPVGSGLEREVTWPMWVAGGVAIKPIPELTITADLQYTGWSVIDKLEADYKDAVWQTLMAGSGKDTQPMEWKNTLQIRFGAEYLISNIALRAGFYNDPSPSPDNTMNVLLPSYDFNAFTFGIGYNNDGLQVDFGIEYLIGKERNIDYWQTITDPAYESAMPGVYNMKVVVPNLSVSYSF